MRVLFNFHVHGQMRMHESYMRVALSNQIRMRVLINSHVHDQMRMRIHES